jgi:tetratricopeptide (TPR) repeat protein
MKKPQIGLVLGCLIIGVVLYIMPNKSSVEQKEIKSDIALDQQIDEAIHLVESGEAPMPGILKLKELEAANPDNRRIQFQLGLFSIKSGQFEKAVARFENVISIDSTDAEAYYYKAHSYAGLGVLDTARMTFEKALLKATEEELKEEIKNYIIELKNLENAKR